ncbi:hypothetical protein BU23DRAFT_557000 [Bimuria novae-zelandiae CBS 107.79]|uniref:Protein transport protein sec16 n=1 Tax=Bimuria novae-zelandiae CBS 107.79 TaxID=1447943 RepID=A0A6A5V0A9_9PLEO|nr:hypothetical protein BU23DRAFT_557000 [Bimuria novae-zelandiae CBS 107.79]
MDEDAPSWNPALRADGSTQQEMAHKLQPSPQIIPQSKPVLEDATEEDEESENDVPHIAAHGPAHRDESPRRPDHAPESEEANGPDFELEQREEEHPGPEFELEQREEEHPGPKFELEQREEAHPVPDFEPEQCEVEHPGPDFEREQREEAHPGPEFEVEQREDAHPENHYEHQGKTTLLEEAVAESAEAPLVADSQPEGDDWGDGDGDGFFGQVAAGQPADSAQARTAEEAPSTSDPAWDLDLDDDFLPDTDFELDDGEGFLEDEPVETPHRPAPPVSTPSTSRYAPATAQAPLSPANPHQVLPPQLTNLTQPSQTPAIPTPTALYGAYGQAAVPQVPTRPGMPSSAESFVAKAREGYHSPYDLPEDIVTTRRRPAPRTASVPTAPPPAPPRTSMSTAGTRPLPPSNMSASSLSPPTSGHAYQPQMTGLPPNAPPTEPAPPPKAPSTDFFAELPITSNPRASGRYTPQPGTPQQHPTHGFAPKERTASWSSLRNEVKPDPETYNSQLQRPERLPVFPDQPTAPVRTNSLPVPQPPSAPSSNRYSPAPAPAPSVPTANTRYSPAPQSAPIANARYSPAPPPPSGFASHSSVPPPSGLPRPPSQNYLPRTSSPLAYHTSQQTEAPVQAQQRTMDRSESSPECATETDELRQQQSPPPPAARSETPPLRSTPSSAVSSPKKRILYAPQYQPMDPSTASATPPADSPFAAVKPPVRHFSNMEPSASAFGTPFQPTYAAPVSQNVNVIPPRCPPSLQYDFIPPTDERAADPLERWRGYPIFKWGLGGTVVTTFPKQVPRYGGGASAPVVKCSPGEVRIHSAKEALPLPEDIAKFPGPLKSRSKKKDVSAWLEQQITALETRQRTPSPDQVKNSDEIKRLDEKILLWKVLQVFIDNDGLLDGNATVVAAVRKIFSFDTDTSADGEGSFTMPADLVGRPRSNTSGVQADPVDPKAVEELSMLLTKGDREKAVWHAVDQRLWAHAMLLSSTLNKDIWKQVVQEFVQKEVKKLGRNNQALAVLYEIFAGNHEDCIDELVPASARAGFQMMSTDGAGPTENALHGLDKWRETLSLILNNRSDGDPTALVSLGKLLAGYGRVEAAHVCFMFAQSQAHINGLDDPDANIVLIGADHNHNPLDLGTNLESVLLTEVYEFGLSLSAQGGSHIIPHLQNYKLAHAYQLAEYGYRADARAYCDAIVASIKATTRVSPYYNGSFVAMLDDLSKRLSQSPKDGSSSWLSKPSMDKVSSSLFSKFTNFVAGDDEDATSNHSAGEVGPFAKISGNTPTLSPTQSSVDLYSAYSGFGIAAAAPATTHSRYAPRTSTESTRSKYEPLGQPSMESNEGNVGMRAVSDSNIPSPQFSNSFTSPQPSQSQLSPHLSSLSKSHSYSPLRSEYNAAESPYSYQPASAAERSAPSYGSFQPPTSGSNNPPMDLSGLQSPANSYEPPSYQPYQPNEEPGPESLNPKKSFMDEDDEDLVARAAALNISPSKTKSDNDRAADEAFRKAAEEDAKRDREAAAQKKSSGWLGGWFGGGKKDTNIPANKPIKAKLGEENSFRYDPELKKWVNTKGGATEATKPIATPPPPRSGPPSRAVSTQGPMGPPSSLPSVNGLSAATSSLAQRSSSMPPPIGLPGSRASTPGLPSDSEGRSPALQRPALAVGPPSRPGTGMSTASSIDDLLGAPQARKGKAGAKKKGGRYVDVMAKP